jgi:drug/metabolite transporter (DMT)-like permease
MLGAIYAALAALTFAMNNAAMRRGVLTGTALQAMVVTVPLGGIGFLIMATLSGQIASLLSFPLVAALWLAGQGTVHFLVGRYFNYQANKLVGVNISAPVVQLQVVVTMLLAVLLLRERFTVLQGLGTVLMLGGSFAAQLQRSNRNAAAETANAVAGNLDIEELAPAPKQAFVPQYLPGFISALAAAVAYGISPLMVRMAFEATPVKHAMAGGVIAYAAATLVLCVFILPVASVRRHVLTQDRRNLIWFVASSVLVAMSQGFVYASLAIAPLMVVTPIMQLSLVFRLFLSQLLNREHEVLNTAVVVGALVTIVGSVVVSLDTSYALSLTHFPDWLADVLRLRIDGHGG